MTESEDELLIDRDLSWLSFNRRILEEAAEPSVPLYERIKFMAIYASNLDEFFRVRVAAIRSLAGLGKKKIKSELDFNPRKLLKQILKEVAIQLDDFGSIFRNDVLLRLRENGIILYHGEEILEEHHQEIRSYFKSHILADIQPYFFIEEDQVFLKNNELYLIIELGSDDKTEDCKLAYLRIPSGFSRFKQLTSIEGKDYIIFLDDIIRLNLSFIFEGHQIKGCYSVKINRDQDVSLETKLSIDIIERVKKQLEKRKAGVPTRFLYDQQMPKAVLSEIKSKLNLNSKEVVLGGRYHNLNDLMDLPNPKSPKLEKDQLVPVSLKSLDSAHYLFDEIDRGDVILHFPYQSYDYILRLFNEAAIDPKVTRIRATLYRIAANSIIAKALISAAQNGKDVAVFVELKARFDEANNIHWAQLMEEAGVKVTYSLPNLKVHAKVALIDRKSDKGLSSYAFFGTGNFNENTAGVYADHGLLTCHEGMTGELGHVFNYLQDSIEIPSNQKHLLIARFNMTDRFLELIDREIMLTKQGNEGQITIKLNNLEEEVMIQKLYEASQAGVKVDLIIRGICRLKPQLAGISDNIRAIRIVDGFLEHARIFKFNNNGKPEIFLSSADWMTRNLHRRIEVGFPIYDTRAQTEIDQLLYLQKEDNVKARLLDEHLNHHRIPQKRLPVRAQLDFHSYLKLVEETQNV